MGKDKQIGSIAAGKNADLVVIKGDPSKQISDVENVEIVFKDGVGYDSRNCWIRCGEDMGSTEEASTQRVPHVSRFLR